MSNREIPKGWEDAEFMFEGAAEVVDANYGKAFSIIRKGIESGLAKPESNVNSKRLLHAIGLLITCLESSLSDTHGIKFDHKTKYKRSENQCSFCCKSRSKVEILVGGAGGFICSSCIAEISSRLNQNT